ncbi:helix-turn-helix transcriptional regulator [Microbacterium sp. NPDC057407]|uniref:helix-turn-helix transcriptional regulator n=1 Tax=Microbacterium sp. NPDC057407 TaxID=3346120 RepID=UPI00366EB99F
MAIGRAFHHFHQHLAGDENIQLHSGRFEGSYSVAIELTQFVVASAVTSCRWEEGRDSGDMALEPVLFRPHTPYINHMTDNENRAVVFEAEAVQTTARRLYGDDRLILTFDGPRPVSPQAGEMWLSVLELARAQHKAGLLRNDLVRASLFRHLTVTMLESFRLVADRPALRASAARQHAIRRTAVDYFHDYASLPITIDDAAAAANVSTRELVTAFRAAHPDNISPTEYLRTVRLAAALEDLRAADPTSGATVSEISRRWGFTSPSRFAALFRSAYGVSPAQVLRN